MTSCDGIAFPTLGPKWLGLPSAKAQQTDRINRSGDELHSHLVKELGPKHSQDAWHFRTAEHCGLYGFLTTDFKFRRQVGGRIKREPLRSMAARVLTPEEFAKELGILALPPFLFSYTDASFFVRADLNMPGGRRRPVTAYKSSGAN